MPNMSDRLATELVANAIDLGRFDTGEQQKLLRLLKPLEAELIAELKRVDPTEPIRSAFQQARIEKLLMAVRGTIASAYRPMATTLRRDLKELAIESAASMQGLVAELTVDSMFSVLPSEAVLRSLVDDLTLQGVPLQRWWSRQATGFFEQYGAIVRAGVLKGQGVPDISRALKGTLERHFQDGLFAKMERNVSTLVRTSIQAVHQNARLETFAQNVDVLRGIEFLTAMDEHVCPICRPFSGATYTLNHRRLPGTKLPYPGPIPLHPRCRCQWLPLIRPYRDLARAKGPRFAEDVKGLTQTVKDALDGGDGVDLTLQVYLKQQPESVQIRALGPTRWQLWQAGKLPLHAMVNAVTRRPYTLDQLTARRRKRSAA